MQWAKQISFTLTMRYLALATACWFATAAWIRCRAGEELPLPLAGEVASASDMFIEGLVLEEEDEEDEEEEEPPPKKPIVVGVGVVDGDFIDRERLGLAGGEEVLIGVWKG